MVEDHLYLSDFGFFNVGTADILGQIILCWWGKAVLRIVGHLAAPLAFTSLTDRGNQKCLETKLLSPGGVGGGRARLSPAENHRGYKSILQTPLPRLL